MTMTVRVRGLVRSAAAALVAGTVVLASSAAWAGRPGEADRPGVWAVRTVGDLAGRSEAQAGARIRPDGIWFIVVKVRIGDGPARLVLTNAATPGELLAALGVPVRGTDLVASTMSQPLAEGDVVRVTAVRRVEARQTTAVAVANGSERGRASWYGRPGLCAASRTLPEGTLATVTDAGSGRSVAVIIDDRGPYGVPGRIIDLCETAFARLAPLSRGVLTVTVGW